MWVMTLWEHGSPEVQWCIVGGASLLAACTDLAWRRIPNWLTFPLLVGGIGFAAYQAGVSGVADSLAACVLLAFPYILLFLFAQGGAGDAKMMGAIGAWLGLMNGLIALACIAIAGIVLAVSLAIMRKRTREVTMNVAGMTQGLFLASLTRTRLLGSLGPGTSAEPMLTMPYGLAIFIGTGIAAIGVLIWRI